MIANRERMTGRMEAVNEKFRRLVPLAAGKPGRVVVLTGAGIAAESGVSTFRGEDGQWQVGSRTYHPVELATWMAFQRMPADIWGWYLYRRARYHAAHPGLGHQAIAALERRLGERCLLVTENVDGLHLRAGNSAERTFQIHGNVDFARCASECCPDIRRLPEDFARDWTWRQRPGEAELEVLTCPRCRGWLRPHVLWFDELADEERFRSDSSLRAIDGAAALVVAGATTAPALPAKMCASAIAHGVLLVVIDAQKTALNDMAAASSNGISLHGATAELLPHVCETIAAQFAG
jgi:NAD-dependent deacetylase